MVVLDTDCLTLLERDDGASLGLQLRLARVPLQEIVTTIVSYEEQTRGWLAYAAQARTLDQQVHAYRLLRSHVETFRRIPLLDFDERAAAAFARLQAARIRIGTMDLKIASIALANDATLLSRNLRDFEKVPGLRVEDWTT